MDQQIDRRQSSSVWTTFGHQSFSSTEWSVPDSVIRVNVKSDFSKKSIQTTKSRVIVINSKQRQPSGKNSCSVNRVSRCGLVLPNNYRKMAGENMTKHERIIAWLNDVNKAYAKHQYRTRWKIKCRCTRQCTMITFICGPILFLIGIILAVLLIIFLIKPKFTVKTEAILRWNQSGITIAGITAISGLAADRLSAPWNIVVDWSNNIFVSDHGNNRIQKFLRGSTNGTTLLGNGNCDHTATTLCAPTGLFVDANENIYIADRINQRIQLRSRDSSVGTTILNIGSSIMSNLSLSSSLNISLFSPYGLHGNSDRGLIFIADHNNNLILSYGLNDSTANVICGSNGSGSNTIQLYRPHASFYDTISDSLLVTNTQMNTIVRYNIGSNQWTLLLGDMNGLSGNTSTLLNYPTDIKLDSLGNIYVADRYNHRIQMFINGQSTGITIAGSGGMSGTNATLLNGPTAFSFDSQLNLYVSDQNNHRIQKFIRY